MNAVHNSMNGCAAPPIANDLVGLEGRVIGDELKAASSLAVLVTFVLGSCTSSAVPTVPNDERSDVVADSPLEYAAISGETFSLDSESRSLLVTVASEGASAVESDELAQLDTFLRFPVSSAVACRTAYEARDK